MKVAKGLTRREALGTSASGVAAGLAGCTTEGSRAPAPAEAQGKVVWSTRVNADENNWQQQIVVPRLKERLPRIDLAFDTAPANEWAVKLISTYAAATPPDVHHGFAGIVISLYAQGQALELTPFIRRDRVDLAPHGGLQLDPDMSRERQDVGAADRHVVDDDGLLQRLPAAAGRGAGAADQLAGPLLDLGPDARHRPQDHQELGRGRRGLRHPGDGG